MFENLLVSLPSTNFVMEIKFSPAMLLLDASCQIKNHP